MYRSIGNPQTAPALQSQYHNSDTPADRETYHKSGSERAGLATLATEKAAHHCGHARRAPVCDRYVKDRGHRGHYVVSMPLSDG